MYILNIYKIISTSQHIQMEHFTNPLYIIISTGTTQLRVAFLKTQNSPRLSNFPGRRGPFRNYSI